MRNWKDIFELKIDRSRRQPLPDTQPKPVTDDPEAEEMLRKIMESPSYIRADKDPALLERDEESDAEAPEN